MAYRITVALLKKTTACSKQVEKFARVFPRGATLSRKNLQKAFDADLYVEWLFRNFADMPEIRAYDSTHADQQPYFKTARKRARRGRHSMPDWYYDKLQAAEDKRLIEAIMRSKSMRLHLEKI